MPVTTTEAILIINVVYKLDLEAVLVTESMYRVQQRGKWLEYLNKKYNKLRGIWATSYLIFNTTHTTADLIRSPTLVDCCVMRWGAHRHGLARQSPSFDRTDASVDSILHRRIAMWGQLWYPYRCISITPRPYMIIFVDGDVGGGAASVLRLYCGEKGVMNHFVDNCNG